ncbi:MAG TPA: hypothetical protein VK184_10085 [Nostocaceae cyanobacterium]|nr:hypothetical protein [Nostocaceae cyanobacterium]
MLFDPRIRTPLGWGVCQSQLWRSRTFLGNKLRVASRSQTPAVGDGSR